MICRDEALKLLRKHIKTENTIKHMLACEAIMLSLARRLEPKKENEWGLAGLLHDIDYEQFPNGNYSKHGEKSVEILKKEKIDLLESVYQVIRMHAFSLNHKFKPQWGSIEDNLLVF